MMFKLYKIKANLSFGLKCYKTTINKIYGYLKTGLGKSHIYISIDMFRKQTAD